MLLKWDKDTKLQMKNTICKGWKNKSPSTFFLTRNRKVNRINIAYTNLRDLAISLGACNK